MRQAGFGQADAGEDRPGIRLQRFETPEPVNHQLPIAITNEIGLRHHLHMIGRGNAVEILRKSGIRRNTQIVPQAGTL